MSVQEMEAMDNELMGMVNSHAAPEAIADAEEIVERATAPTPAPAAEPAAQLDCLQETEGYYRISKKQFAELEARVEAESRRKTWIVVILSVLLVTALLVVLAKPSLLIWLVSIGVVSCAVTAGIAIDRRWGR